MPGLGRRGTVSDWLAPDGALVTVTDRGREKYGRTLADITLHRGGSVAATLIAEGHGKPYAGGAR